MRDRYGYCYCGCGVKTPLSKRNRKNKGWIKGCPHRYITGHNIIRKGYLVKDNGCWIWDGKPNDKGYGRTWVNGKNIRAHRFVYEKIKGAIPAGLHLDHLCRNPICVNPDHLEPVTVAENVRRGMVAKLNMTAVNRIRALAVDGASQRSIAKVFGVSSTEINHIVNGKRWAF